MRLKIRKILGNNFIFFVIRNNLLKNLDFVLLNEVSVIEVGIL